MRLGDPPRDREAEPRAPPRALRVRASVRVGRLDAEEAVEDPLARLGRHAGAAVDDLEHVPGAASRRAHLHTPAGRRVPDPVVEQVEEQPAQQPLVAAERQVPVRRGAHLDVARRGERAHGARGVGAEVGEVELLAHDALHARVRPREQEEVVDDAAHAPGLLADRRERAAQLGRRPVGARERELRLAADDRDRGAQLVRGVGHEAALPLERGLEAAEQLVEHRGEPPELVVGVLHREPRVQRARTDARRALRHRRHGAQALARERVAAARGEQQHERRDDGEREPRLAQRALLRAERRRGADDEVASAEAVRPRVDAHRRRVPVARRLHGRERRPRRRRAQHRAEVGRRRRRVAHRRRRLVRHRHRAAAPVERRDGRVAEPELAHDDEQRAPLARAAGALRLERPHDVGRGRLQRLVDARTGRARDEAVARRREQRREQREHARVPEREPRADRPHRARDQRRRDGVAAAAAAAPAGSSASM